MTQEMQIKGKLKYHCMILKIAYIIKPEEPMIYGLCWEGNLYSLLLVLFSGFSSMWSNKEIFHKIRMELLFLTQDLHLIPDESLEKTTWVPWNSKAHFWRQKDSTAGRVFDSTLGRCLFWILFWARHRHRIITVISWIVRNPAVE